MVKNYLFKTIILVNCFLFLFTNNGKAQCTYASSTSISAATFLACGSITINAGVTLTVTGAVTNNTAGANITVTDNGYLVFNSGITLNSTGNLSVTGTGSMTVQSGGLTINSSGSYSNGVNTAITGAVTGGNSGSITNTGTLTVTGNITLNSNGGLTNSGTISVVGNVTIANSGGITSSGAFSVTGNVTENSSGSFTDNGSLTIGGNYSLQNSGGISGTGSAYVNGTASTTGSGTFWGSSTSCTGCTLNSSGSLLSSCDFKYRRLITINSAKVSGGVDLTNFPMLVNITSDATLKSVANGGHVQSANGYDVMFTAMDGVTNLNFQLEKYVATTGQYVAWVNIPTLSASKNTYIYMYYGDASVSTDQSTTSTWDANHVGVWHLDSNAFSANYTKDFTSNGNTATNHNSKTNIAGGEIVDARAFAGSTAGHTTDYTHLGLTGASSSAGTIALWGKITTFNTSTYFFGHSSTQNATYTDRIQLYQSDAAGTLELGLGSNHTQANVATLAINTWNHIALTWSTTAVGSGNGNYVVYVNGVSKASGTYSNFSALASFADIGNDGNAGQETEALTGSVDEIHISNTARTAGWITTEYNNQSSPSTFYTLAGEPNTWTGVTSTAWSANSNWSSGTAPAAASGVDIIIANGTFQPSLSAANTQVNSIYINNGATLSLGTRNLSVYADITNCGTLQGGTGTVILNGSSAQVQTLSGSGTYNIYDLTVNNTSGINPGVKFVQNVTVNDVYTHTTGTLDLNGHTLNITNPTATANSFFTAGSIITSVSGGSISITDANNVANIKFNGTNFGNSTYGVNITCSSSDSYFNGGAFYGTVNFTKTGSGIDDCNGGCYFHGPCTFNTSLGSDRWRMGNLSPDTFNTATFNHLDTTSGSNFIVARQTLGNYFTGTTTIYSAAQGGFYVGRNNAGGSYNGSAYFNGPVVATVTSKGNIYFAESSTSVSNTVTFNSSVTLNSASGASSLGFIQVGTNQYSTINLTNTGQFLHGTIKGATNIYLYNVSQTGGLTQTIESDSTSKSTLYIGYVNSSTNAPCTFNGPVLFTAPNINFAGNTFNGTPNILTANGNTGQTCTGGNTFAAATTTTFRDSGAGYWELATKAPDIYNGNVAFNQVSTGTLVPNYNTTCTYGGNITVTSPAGTSIYFGKGGTSGKTNLTGSSAQTISLTGAGNAPIFRNLLMNNTSAAGVTLNTPASVVDSLVMTSGLLNTSSTNSLTMSSGSFASALTSASTSYVNGPLNYQKSTTASQTLNFPIGAGGDCRPVTLTVKHTTTNLYNYTAQLYSGSAFSVGTYTNYPATVDTLSGVHYWQLARTDASSVSQPTLELNTTAANLPQVTLYFGADDQVYDGSLLTVCKTLYTDPNGWYDIGQGSTTIPAAQSATPEAGSITSSTSGPTAFNSFSYFTLGRLLGAGKNPLPIKLLDFTAVPDGEKVDVAWQTVTEVNNAYFTVEKSKDGTNFTKVIDVPGAGNSTTLRDYAETDYQPYIGTSYYRLKQTDKNGVFTYSSIVPVNFKAQQNIIVYPNPIDSKTSLNVKVFGFQNQEVIVVLRDAQGREFLSKVLLSVENNQVFIIDEMQSLAPGVYIVTASSNDKIYNSKLIVK